MTIEPDGELAIPPALAERIHGVAAEQHRPAVDVVRDALEAYLDRNGGPAETNDPLADFEPPEDELPLTDTHRLAIREKIAQGLRSLRDGQGTDGATFLSEMEAELQVPDQPARL